MSNVKQTAFRQKLKEEWTIMWKERFDDKAKAEGVAVRDYPLLFMDQGFVIFASRDAKTPILSEIVAIWASQGLVYYTDPSVGGWRKFIRTELRKVAHSRADSFQRNIPRDQSVKQQLKKNGRGWLHV
jgi:hypothetical protein